MELTVVNSQYSVVQTVPVETTELNGQYSLVSREPNETTAEPTAQYSVVQKEPKQTTEPSGQYSLVQAGPNETTDAQYSVVQTRPKKTKEAPVQLEPLQTTESNRHCSTVQEPLQADQVRGIQFCFSQLPCNLKIPTLHRYDRNYFFQLHIILYYTSHYICVCLLFRGCVWHPLTKLPPQHHLPSLHTLPPLSRLECYYVCVFVFVIPTTLATYGSFCHWVSVLHI